MKVLLATVLAVFILAGTSCHNEVDIEKEKEAIIAVIENETKSYFDSNYEQQSISFLQDESLIVLVSGKKEYGYAVGWDQVSKNHKTNYEKNPLPDTDRFQNIDYKIKVYEKSAWAVYDEMVYSGEGEFIRKVINVRFLEKVDGAWRIAYLSHVDATSYEVEMD